MKLISVRLNPSSLDAISKIYETQTDGVQKSINAFLELRKVYVHSLKGKFTREEIIAMADSLNGTMADERFMVNPSIAFAGFEDSEKYDGTFSTHNANFESFRQKFLKLSPVECFFIIEEIYRFWNVPLAYGAPTPDLEKLVSDFTA